ncbi:uncharacterized protein LOC128672768 [Plodia interpunctella]|uniref:uncharacterized protein LOC128672768 n=1 Tax=Plodia interpunctella TaxID=58824 RepID=UPI00236800C6|nr:uncharacterized protein LOC128672768 [Plodia interpunctella]
MHFRQDVVLQTKSFTSIYEIFGPKSYKNRGSKCTRRTNKTNPTRHHAPGTKYRAKEFENDTSESTYVTCEKYHNLNKYISLTSDLQSTSTLFYDLDSIAVRHSFADLSGISYINCHSNIDIPHNQSPNGFRAPSHAIVQECETNVKPNLLPRDSLEITSTKKIEKCFPNDPDLSSEIFLKDDEFNGFPVNDESDRQLNRNQKYWSYAKYRTEYTNPSRQEKKSKKKERTRQIEDPCPCQLFTYTCPCNNDKSLTGFKHVRSLTDQITSTTNIFKEERKDFMKTPFTFSRKKNKGKEKNITSMDDKPTSITCVIANDDCFEKSEQTLVCSDKYDISQTSKNHTASLDKSTSSCKKRRKLFCQNCKEKVEVCSVVPSEEEESLIYEDSNYQSKDSPPGQSIYTYKTSVRKQIQEKLKVKDTCRHTPRCELVPLCQVLPTDNIFLNYKTVKKNDKNDAPKNSPRVIRVTKACRHHPPCTVAPSCQRANILKNNCEFIPPCLHRPRCVNLPLCVPISKNLNYDDLKSLDEMQNECPHTPRCKYVPECKQFYSNQPSNQVNVARMHNTYGLLRDYQTTSYPQSKSPIVPQSFSPCQIHPSGYTTNSNVPRSNKSCQCVIIDLPLDPSMSNIQDAVSSEAVVFIRDVGCQFRNKYNSNIDSIRSVKSSTTFDQDNIRLGNVYTNVHTLRCEDKYTNPTRQTEASTSSLSLTSNYMGTSARPCDSHNRPSGFDPMPTKTPLVVYATNISSQTKYNNENNMANAASIRSRVSFLTGSKYRKMFNIKRKRKRRSDVQLSFYRHGSLC